MPSGLGSAPAGDMARITADLVTSVMGPALDGSDSGTLAAVAARDPAVEIVKVAGAPASHAEVGVLGRRLGARPETLAGLAGVGGLVAGAGRQAQPTGDALDALGLLAYALREHGVAAPTTEGLAAVAAGETKAADWAHAVTAPGAHRRAA